MAGPTARTDAGPRLAAALAVLDTRIKTCLYLQMAKPFDFVLDELRAVAEPSRLRLLVILAGGEFSVTELTEVLGQSQPRVSRHLKLLCDAGLLEKFREQHWIYYRVPAEGAGRELVEQLVARIAPADPTLAADVARVEAVLEARRASGHRGGEPPAPPGNGDLAAAFADELGDRGRGALFYYGPSPTDVLGLIATRARRVVGMHTSRMEVQRARASLHSRGMSHCALQQGEARTVPHPSGEFDTAVLDRTLATQARPVEALREACRLLNAGGELLVAEDYDALAATAAGSNPLATLKGWLADAGLVCARLRPLDLDGQHLLLAVAHPGRRLPDAA
jgi:ArsR family transcriptional regulator